MPRGSPRSESHRLKSLCTLGRNGFTAPSMESGDSYTILHSLTHGSCASLLSKAVSREQASTVLFQRLVPSTSTPFTRNCST